MAHLCFSPTVGKAGERGGGGLTVGAEVVGRQEEGGETLMISCTVKSFFPPSRFCPKFRPDLYRS